MEERRRVTTVRQLELMVQFLEGHQDLALGRVRSKEARNVATRLWQQCASMLNSEGPVRTRKEWAKVWNDYKCRVRAKLVSINASQRATGGGPSTAPTLTKLEGRAARIIGRDVGPLLNVRKDLFSSNDNDNVVMVVEVKDEPPSQTSPMASSPIILKEDENEPLPNSPVPSVTGQAGVSMHDTPRCTGERVRRWRERQRQDRTRRASRQRTTHSEPISGRSALDEYRAMVLHIEEMRAEAELKNAQATCSFAESFKLIAESIDRLSQKYCQQQNQQEEKITETKRTC